MRNHAATEIAQHVLRDRIPDGPVVGRVTNEKDTVGRVAAQLDLGAVDGARLQHLIDSDAIVMRELNQRRRAGQKVRTRTRCMRERTNDVESRLERPIVGADRIKARYWNGSIDIQVPIILQNQTND